MYFGVSYAIDNNYVICIAATYDLKIQLWGRKAGEQIGL